MCHVFEHEVIFRRAVLSDLTQTDLEVRKASTTVSVTSAYFWNQVNASYRAAYAMRFEHEVTF